MDDGYGSNYESDWTANTQNSEAPYDFNVNITEYDFNTSASVNGNREMYGIPRQNDLDVNAATELNQILHNPCRGQRHITRKPIPKSSEMSAGAVAKIKTNTQQRIVDKDNNTTAFITFATKMTVIDYARYDSLIFKDQRVTESHYKVNLSNTIMGGKNLALCDGGVNGTIIGRDMKVLHYNCDAKRVSIGVKGDNQITGKR